MFKIIIDKDIRMLYNGIVLKEEFAAIWRCIIKEVYPPCGFLQRALRGYTSDTCCFFYPSYALLLVLFLYLRNGGANNENIECNENATIMGLPATVSRNEDMGNHTLPIALVIHKPARDYVKNKEDNNLHVPFYAPQELSVISGWHYHTQQVSNSVLRR